MTNVVVGSAGAAGTVDNVRNGTIGSTDLADHAVTSYKMAVGSVDNARLAAGAVSAAKVANDALTGAQINESSLAKVPGATNADKLGGLDQFAFGRLIALKSFSNAGTPAALGADSNYYLAPAFTLSKSGRCSVTASVQAQSSPAPT